MRLRSGSGGFDDCHPRRLEEGLIPPSFQPAMIIKSLSVPYSSTDSTADSDSTMDGAIYFLLSSNLLREKRESNYW